MIENPVDAQSLADQILQNLEGLGFPIHDGEIRHGVLSKDEIRGLHALHRADELRKNVEHIDRYLDQIAPFFCDGADVDPLKIDPFIRPVSTDLEGSIFRAATMLWSVPVSQGYGRRTRFLICDRQNGALVGVFALGDPVFNLTVRDRLIGWNSKGREDRLYQCFDAFVLGAVPPYRELLGGKLAALCAISNESRQYLERKYVGSVTNIRAQVKPATPVLISTTSALGRSSIYNRLKFGTRRLYYSVGYTKGFGHFHIPDQLFALMVRYLQQMGRPAQSTYGFGPNYRMRVTRLALTLIGLNPELLRHGVQREVFLAPVAHNWREILRGEEIEADPIDLPLRDLSEFFVARWAFPRAMRDGSYKAITGKQTLSLIRPGAPVMDGLLGSQYARDAWQSSNLQELRSH